MKLVLAGGAAVIAAARAATTGPIGVNLFVPQPSVAEFHRLDHYADALDELAGWIELVRYGSGWVDECSEGRLEGSLRGRRRRERLTFGLALSRRLRLRRPKSRTLRG